nr:MAG TPA: hypothetical protein [Caudoviricetes sp.]
MLFFPKGSLYIDDINRDGWFFLLIRCLYQFMNHLLVSMLIIQYGSLLHSGVNVSFRIITRH